MRSLSSKRSEGECAAESDSTRALREILGISINEDLFGPGEAVGVIGAIAERALYRFEEIPSDIGSQFPGRMGPVQFTELTGGCSVPLTSALPQEAGAAADTEPKAAL